MNSLVYNNSELNSVSADNLGVGIFSYELLPEEKFTSQNEYVVTVNKKVKSLGGKSLEGKNKFNFHTEYLGIESYSPSNHDVPLAEAKKIRLTFKYPVKPVIPSPQL